MTPFAYSAPASVDAALAAMAANAHQPPTDVPAQAHRGTTVCIAGGTNLVDLMKERVAQPAALININGLPLADIKKIADGGLQLGAVARNADTAQHPLVRKHYPLLRAALLAGASPQIRNMASNGGNLLQRTRCLYFYDAAVPCNKHTPGSGCPAATGLARQHAILGAEADCIATHPSDMCVALAALGATVHVRSLRGERAIAFEDFHRLPQGQPHIDTTLAPDELITHITLPPADHYASHSSYLKLRERASYAFALVAVAAALDLADDGSIRSARLALGGVAHKPWRNQQAEALLAGQQPTDAAFEAAAALVLAPARAWGAEPLASPDGGVADTSASNAFKLPLARRAIVRALQMALAGVVSNTGEDAAAAQGGAAQTGRIN